MGCDYRTALAGESEKEKSPNVSDVLLGMSEEEDDVNSNSLSPSEIVEKEHIDSQFWFIVGKMATLVLHKDTSVLTLVNSMSLNPPLDSKIANSKGVKKDVDEDEEMDVDLQGAPHVRNVKLWRFLRNRNWFYFRVESTWPGEGEAILVFYIFALSEIRYWLKPFLVFSFLIL